MKHREEIILHIKRVDNERPKPRLKFSESLLQKITVRDDNEISKKRHEFEIQLLRVTLGISQQAAEYLLQQHGRMALVAAGGDYQERQFVAWLESSHARLEVTRSVKKDFWESRLLKLAKHFVPKNAREERLGDLQEVCDELTVSGCGKLKRRLLTTRHVFLIAFAQVRIGIRDLTARDSTV
jgi:hypothetical protein